MPSTGDLRRRKGTDGGGFLIETIAVISAWTGSLLILY